LIDISKNGGNLLKVSVYLDGLDARIFSSLVSRLGSEEKAQEAIILVGMIERLSREKTRSSQLKIGKIRSYFRDNLKFPLEDMYSVIDEA
jgi:hypothetical protein